MVLPLEQALHNNKLCCGRTKINFNSIKQFQNYSKVKLLVSELLLAHKYKYNSYR